MALMWCNVTLSARLEHLPRGNMAAAAEEDHDEAR